MEPTEVADALRRAHESLLRELGNLEQAVRPISGNRRSGDGRIALIDRLEATLVHLTEHFRFEEQNGYMHAVRQREPRLERAVQHLADEHRELKESLETLIAKARAASGLEDSFRSEIRAWIESVWRHESRENELIEDAFNLNISAAD
jgi:hypothetical protein